MEFAFMTEPQAGGSYKQLLRLALWAEREGFAVFSRSDHYMDGDRSVHATDALTTLAALGRDTSTIRLNVLVSPASFRHPATLAKTAATIDELSDGRFELGVGTGWMESEHEVFGYHFPDWGERFDRLTETLAYLRAALGRAEGGFSGEYYRMADVPVLPLPTGDLPLIVGGSGPRRSPRLAGLYADEFNMFTRPVEEFATRRDVMRRSASEAGRDPDAIKLSLAGSPIVGADRQDYRERLRNRASARELTETELTAILEAQAVPHGTSDQAATQLAEFEKAGVSRFYINVYAPLDEIDLDEVSTVRRLLA